MVTNYASGYEVEKQINRQLKDLGYHTIRSAGSHGPIDVLAWDSVNRYAIQCKKDSSPFSNTAFDELLVWATDLIATPVLLERKNRKTTWMILRRTVGNPLTTKMNRYLLPFKMEKAEYRK